MLGVADARGQASSFRAFILWRRSRDRGPPLNESGTRYDCCCTISQLVAKSTEACWQRPNGGWGAMLRGIGNELGDELKAVRGRRIHVGGSRDSATERRPANKSLKRFSIVPIQATNKAMQMTAFRLENRSGTKEPPRSSRIECVSASWSHQPALSPTGLFMLDATAVGQGASPTPQGSGHASPSQTQQMGFANSRVAAHHDIYGVVSK